MEELRQEYRKHELLESDLKSDPFDQFSLWFNDAMQAEVIEPNAMILSTRSEKGVDSRTVLLKGVEDEQFVFYTNYNSHKAQQLINDPSCSLVFLWLGMERQVIVRGKAQKHSEQASTDYFNSRPRESRIGAWVSDQSSEINNREELEAKLQQYQEKFENKEVPKPEHWGGFCITPYEIEFWQGRPSRLHDRICYFKEDGAWKYKRLQP